MLAEEHGVEGYDHQSDQEYQHFEGQPQQLDYGIEVDIGYVYKWHGAAPLSKDPGPSRIWTGLEVDPIGGIIPAHGFCPESGTRYHESGSERIQAVVQQ